MKCSVPLVLTVGVLLFGVLACDVAIDGVGTRETVHGSGTVVEQARSLSDLSSVELAMVTRSPLR